MIRDLHESEQELVTGGVGLPSPPPSNGGRVGTQTIGPDSIFVLIPTGASPSESGDALDDNAGLLL